MKFIKKGTIKEIGSVKLATLGTVLLTGTIAFAATGCTTEVKADGITIESVIVSGNADGLTSAVNVNTQPGTPQADPAAATVADKTPETSLPAETTEPSGEQETTATPTASVTVTESSQTNNTNNNNSSNTNTTTTTPAKMTLNALKEETVTHFMEESEGDFRLSGDFGKIWFYVDEYNQTVFNINDKVFYSDITSVRAVDGYLIRHNGKTFVYVEAVRGCNIHEINVYEISDSSVSRVGVASNLCTSDCYLNNTTSFMCCEEYGKGSGFATRRNYKVSANGMPVPSDNFITIEVCDYSRAIKDINGYLVKDGKVTSTAMTIKAGEVAFPVKVNEVEYIDFKDAYGNTIRADFTKACETYYDQNNCRWAFNAIKSMVKEDNSYVLTVKDIQDGTAYKFDQGKGDLFFGTAYANLLVEIYKVENIRITYEDKSFVFPLVDGCERIKDAYLLKSAGKAYIYVTAPLEGENEGIYVFEVTEDSIEYITFVSDLKVIGTITSSKSFECYVYDGMNGVISIKGAFKVDTNGLPVTKDFCFNVASSCSVKAAKDLSGYVVKNDKITTEQMSIKAGDVVVPQRVVAMQYLEVMDSNCNIIRIDMEEIFCDFYDIGNNQWMHEAILSILQPV
ncbi:MAG: hypothetical protein IKS75_02840 [Clostridiales bacterium]|nr:hypothetical protein [Clostridiales bacterium]